MFFGMALFIGIIGCSISQSLSESDYAKISINDCAKVFHWTDDCETFRDSDGKQYYKAWHKGYGDASDELLGYVFPKRIVYKTDTAYILVGVIPSPEGTGGRIHKVITLSSTFIIPSDFLLQFNEKGIQDSFEIVRGVDDLLSVPSKIKPIFGKKELSEMIADSVKEVLSSVNMILAKK